MTNPSQNKLLKSFARRVGKALSSEQQAFLANDLPNYLIDASQPLSKCAVDKKIFLEIGCGMGENLINHSIHDAESIYIGCEPYLNGIANCLRMRRQHNISNLLLWPDDVDLVLPNIPDNGLNGIIILFPDPWHKRRHNKRRIMNDMRLHSLIRILKQGGTIWFGTDIEDYFQQVQELFGSCRGLKITLEEAQPPYYVITKYNKKALSEGRKARFLKAINEGN